MKSLKLSPAVLVAGLLFPGIATATDGYFAHGYGVKSQGMAGIGIALPQDGLAAATNPAGTAFVGDRVDVGVYWFQPNRDAEVSGNRYFSGSYNGNDRSDFFIPEFGYVNQLDSRWSAGVAIYGNGGMNTDYKVNPWRNMGSSGSAGINLEQLFVSPSLAFKVSEDHSIGVAVNLAYQRFKAKGLEAFSGLSSSPANFTNNGTESSAGWGLRFGYTGKITPDLTIGATYATKTWMGKLDKYKGLFADQGSFDIPANYGVGLSWQATKALLLAVDVQRIEYSGVKSVGNSLDTASLFAGNLFGSANGPGFGWRDVTVVKVGTSYDVNPDLTIRGGYSHMTQPVPSGQTLLNILAPGVVQDHVSLGATWKSSANGELSFSYTHAFKKTVSGAIPGAFGGGSAQLSMDENMVGVAYGWKY